MNRTKACGTNLRIPYSKVPELHAKLVEAGLSEGFETANVDTWSMADEVQNVAEVQQFFTRVVTGMDIQLYSWEGEYFDDELRHFLWALRGCVENGGFIRFQDSDDNYFGFLYRDYSVALIDAEVRWDVYGRPWYGQ